MNVKHILFFMFIAVLAMSGCGPAPEPTMSPADVQGTAMAAALTMVAETQAAIPTDTPIPPTETPMPSPTPSLTQVIFGTPSFEVFPTATLASTSGDANCNQPLTKWDGEVVKLTARNNTKPKGLVTLSLFFTTDYGACGYIGAQFDNSVTLSVPTGVFSAGAFVDGKKDFKVFGGGRITPGSWSLSIENEAILLKAGCAPDC